MFCLFGLFFLVSFLILFWCWEFFLSVAVVVVSLKYNLCGCAAGLFADYANRQILKEQSLNFMKCQGSVLVYGRFFKPLWQSVFQRDLKDLNSAIPLKLQVFNLPVAALESSSRNAFQKLVRMKRGVFVPRVEVSMQRNLMTHILYFV